MWPRSKRRGAAEGAAVRWRARTTNCAPTDAVSPTSCRVRGKTSARSGSRAPLARLRTLHRRWFEFFDLDAGTLIETETERDARDPRTGAAAPAQSASRTGTADDRTGSWRQNRVGTRCQCAANRSRARTGARKGIGCIHCGLGRGRRRCSRSIGCSIGPMPSCRRAKWTSMPARRRHARALRDLLDSHAALDIDLQPHLPAHVWAWYRRS